MNGTYVYKSITIISGKSLNIGKECVNTFVFCNNRILPLKILVKNSVVLLMHKLSNGNVPKPFQNVYKFNRDVHIYFTRQAYHFHSMRRNNECIYISFVLQSVIIWNKLIQKIITCVSYPRFKYILKYFLLSDDVTLR